MNSRELYINGKLCDLPVNYSPRLNRQLINPSELAVKDAQYSYSITLPPTSRNNEALGYVGVEEVYNKFNRRYTAELIINGVRIFKGYFKLSEVSANGYKGNLYKPNAKSSKEIFPSEKWADMKGHYISFAGFAESISKYNEAARTEVQPAIFPYVLYGLIPKMPNSGYGERDEWDERVSLSWDDVYPSMNLLGVLRAAFESRGLSLEGDAFDDEHLKNIYVSYKNESAYALPWNYGRNGRISVQGSWKNASITDIGLLQRPYEQVATFSSADECTVVQDVLGGSNTQITTLDDPGGAFRNGSIIVPSSGYYKISMQVSFSTYARKGEVDAFGQDPNTGLRYHIDHSGFNYLEQGTFELRLMRANRGDYVNMRRDATFLKDNIPQDVNSEVKYLPQVVGDTSFLVVDEKHDDKLIVGVSFGKIFRGVKYSNPLDTREAASNILIKSPFLSWSEDAWVEAEKRNLTLAQMPGYIKMRNNAVEEITDKYKLTLKNIPTNFTTASKHGISQNVALLSGYGKVNVIAWLNKGEELSLISVSETNLLFGEWTGIRVHGYDFSMELTPFRYDRDWIPLSHLENGTLPELDWNDSATFESDRIDLFKFMPSNEKVSDFIDNVCKAFNLRLSDLGNGAFSLDKAVAKIENDFVELDGISAVPKRVNQPLGMPTAFNLSFTTNEKEEGYYLEGDKGVSGSIITGAIDGGTVEQKCNFSYNWFKKLKKGGDLISLPIISEHEAWAEENTYGEAMEKRYTNLAQRFWFYDGTFQAKIKGNDTSLARVTNSNGLELSYENKYNTILRLYFATLVDANSHYTEIECYLTPDLYEALNGRKKAIFNGDVYYVAEISGYDPSGRNKSKIKLIRRI